MFQYTPFLILGDYVVLSGIGVCFWRGPASLHQKPERRPPSGEQCPMLFPPAHFGYAFPSRERCGPQVSVKIFVRD